MTYIPDKTAFTRRHKVTFLGAVTVLLVALSVFILVKVRTVWSIIIAVSLFLIAFIFQKIAQDKSSRMAIQVSILGVVWFHPAKGGGTLPWTNIGALSIREVARNDSLSLVITPRDMEKGDSMIVDSADLEPGPGGKARLVELTGELMNKMPPDTVIDRSTRAWAERMGLSRGKG